MFDLISLKSLLYIVLNIHTIILLKTYYDNNIATRLYTEGVDLPSRVLSPVYTSNPLLSLKLFIYILFHPDRAKGGKSFTLHLFSSGMFSFPD